MSDITFTSRSYGKIMMHAAKYPHCALNGVLLADSDRSKESLKNHKITVVDAIPLFHQCLHVTPMVEIALSQIDALADAAGLTVVGYYAASDNFKENSIEKAPGSRIADKIAELFPAALFVVFDNRSFSLDLDSTVLKVAQFNDNKWKMKDPKHVIVDDDTSACVSRLLRNAAYKSLVDYDNHLDDITLDWTNSNINTQIDQLMKMCA